MLNLINFVFLNYELQYVLTYFKIILLIRYIFKSFNLVTLKKIDNNYDVRKKCFSKTSIILVIINFEGLIDCVQKFCVSYVIFKGTFSAGKGLLKKHVILNLQLHITENFKYSYF